MPVGKVAGVLVHAAQWECCAPGLGYSCRIADHRDAGVAPAAFSSWSSKLPCLLAHVGERLASAGSLTWLTSGSEPASVTSIPAPVMCDRPPPVLGIGINQSGEEIDIGTQ
jgi:hypothetical protein